MEMNDDSPASLEDLLQQSGFCRLSAKPPNLVQCPGPTDDVALANIVVNRLVLYWPVPEEHELVAVYVREGRRIKAALQNEIVWLPLTPRQAEQVAWYLRTHLRPASPLPGLQKG